jgi:hypothetical protein
VLWLGHELDATDEHVRARAAEELLEIGRPTIDRVYARAVAEKVVAYRAPEWDMVVGTCRRVSVNTDRQTVTDFTCEEEIWPYPSAKPDVVVLAHELGTGAELEAGSRYLLVFRGGITETSLTKASIYAVGGLTYRLDGELGPAVLAAVRERCAPRKSP